MARAFSVDEEKKRKGVKVKKHEKEEKKLM